MSRVRRLSVAATTTTIAGYTAIAHYLHARAGQQKQLDISQLIIHGGAIAHNTDRRFLSGTLDLISNSSAAGSARHFFHLNPTKGSS